MIGAFLFVLFMGAIFFFALYPFNTKEVEEVSSDREYIQLSTGMIVSYPVLNTVEQDGDFIKLTTSKQDILLQHVLLKGYTDKFQYKKTEVIAKWLK